MFDDNFTSCINTKGIKCHTLPPLIRGELYFVYKYFVVTGIMIKTFTLKTEELSCASQSHLIPFVFIQLIKFSSNIDLPR
jgi:hypothetical protein